MPSNPQSLASQQLQLQAQIPTLEGLPREVRTMIYRLSDIMAPTNDGDFPAIWRAFFRYNKPLFEEVSAEFRRLSCAVNLDNPESFAKLAMMPEHARQMLRHVHVTFGVDSTAPGEDQAPFYHFEQRQIKKIIATMLLCPRLETVGLDVVNTQASLRISGKDVLAMLLGKTVRRLVITTPYIGLLPRDPPIRYMGAGLGQPLQSLVASLNNAFGHNAVGWWGRNSGVVEHLVWEVAEGDYLEDTFFQRLRAKYRQ